jgi:hypothetical protein
VAKDSLNVAVQELDSEIIAHAILDARWERDGAGVS